MNEKDKIDAVMRRLLTPKSGTQKRLPKPTKAESLRPFTIQFEAETPVMKEVKNEK